MATLIRAYPGINVEIDTSYGLVDIVAERYDVGVRSDEAIARDMIALRISPDFRRVIVGSPSYFGRHGVPEDPEALLAHDCIALRQRRNGAIYAWPRVKEGREQTVRVQARFTFNGYQVLSAALSGCGVALSPKYLAGAARRGGKAALRAGGLVPCGRWLLRLLPESSPHVPGCPPRAGGTPPARVTQRTCGQKLSCHRPTPVNLAGELRR